VTNSLEDAQASPNFKALGRTVERLRTPVGFVEPDSTLLYLNSAGARLLGRSESELLGSQMLALVHPDDRERVERKFEGIVRGAVAGGFTQFRVRAEDNKGWVVIDCYAHNLVDDPEVRSIIVSFGEVTEQYRLSKALRALSNSNHLLVHATDEAELVANICQTIIESGQYVLAWVGYVEMDDDRAFEPSRRSVHRDGSCRHESVGATTRTETVPRDRPFAPDRCRWFATSDALRARRLGANSSPSKASAPHARSHSSSTAPPSAR
jgi:PAS domain S-box-containing protein